MKKEILEILRNSNGTVSGEVLRSRLGKSRVSVWKHIRKLQECGYDIAAGPSGYRLVGDPDIPYPWEFSGHTSDIHYYPRLSSTMDKAREKARKGCPDFTVVIAGQQTAGRGRLDRTWESAEGGLYFTVVLRPQIPPVLSYRVNFAASLVLVQLINEMARVRATVKWPNDILAGDRKLSGMLSEMEAEADRVVHINLGIGINVNNDPAPAEPAAVSLAELSGGPVSRKEILMRFVGRFRRVMADLPLDNVVRQWKRHTSTLNRAVRIETLNGVTEGRAVDLDEDGALIVRIADGTHRRIVYGDCFYC